MPTLFVLRLLLLRGPPAPIDTVGADARAVGDRICRRLAGACSPGPALDGPRHGLTEPAAHASGSAHRLSAGFVLMAGLVLYGYFVTVMTLSRHVIASLGVLLLIASVMD
jgi:hypothetical protein